MAQTVRPGFHIIPTEQGPAQITSMALLLSLHAHSDPQERPIIQLVFEYLGGGPLDLITARYPFRMMMSAN